MTVATLRFLMRIMRGNDVQALAQLAFGHPLSQDPLDRVAPRSDPQPLSREQKLRVALLLRQQYPDHADVIDSLVRAAYVADLLDQIGEQVAGRDAAAAVGVGDCLRDQLGLVGPNGGTPTAWTRRWPGRSCPSSTPGTHFGPGASCPLKEVLVGMDPRSAHLVA